VTNGAATVRPRRASRAIRRALLSRATRRRRWRFGLVCAVLAGLPAFAYVPSVNLLFRKAAARVSEGGRTRGDVALMGTSQTGDGAPAPRTLLLRFPLACRFEGGAQVRGTTVQPLPASSASSPEQELIELACPLIAYRGLRNADALDRLLDRVAVSIGAAPRQLDRPQLWLYKDTNAPARLVARRDGHVEDLRLLEYGNPAAAEWFPRILELYRDGKPSIRFEVLETKGFRAPTEEEQDDDRE